MCISPLSSVHLTIDLVILIICLCVCIIRFVAHMFHCCFGFGWMKQNKWQNKFIPVINEHKNCRRMHDCKNKRVLCWSVSSTPVLFTVACLSFYRSSYV